MADVATLGISVDSSNVRKATGDLDGFAAAMGRVTNSSGATSRAFKTMNGEAKTTGGIVDKAAANVLKFGTSYGLAADKLRGGLVVLEAQPNNGALSSHAFMADTHGAVAASANIQPTGDKDYDYFLAHRADFANDTGKGIADILLSATSFAVKGIANEKIPYVGEVGEWVGNWIESFSPAIMREKSAAQIKSDAQLAREVQSLPGQKNNPAVADFAAERIAREDLLNQTVGFRKSADRTSSQALGKFESVAGGFDASLSVSAGRADSQLFELGNSYVDFKDKLKAGSAQIADALNFDKVLSKTAAQMPDYPELAEFSKNFKGVLGSITQDLTVANGLKAQHEVANRPQSVAVDPAKQATFAQAGIGANMLLPNIAAFSRVSPLAIDTTSKQPIVGSVGVQNSQKDELQGIQQVVQATDALTKSSKVNTEQAKVGIQTSAKAAAATEEEKTKVVKLTQSQDNLQKSCAARLQQMPQLTQKTKEQAAANEQLANAQKKLVDDMAFERAQIGRSTIDQTVAKTLKDRGLPVEMDSKSAEIVRTNEQLKYARQLVGDFASTLMTSLRNGEGFWKSFGKAAVSVLTKISDTLLNDVLNSLFQVNSAASGGGGGGLLSGLLGIFGFGGGSEVALPTGSNIPIPMPRPTFANGGYTGPGGVFDPVGIVHAGEVVWSQKDIARAGGVGVVEAMRLGRRGYADGGVVGEGGPQLLRAQPDAAVPVRRLRADNQNDASGSASGVHVTVGVSVDEDGNLKAYVKNVAQSEAQSSTRHGLNDFNQQLPDRVAQINRNPRRR